MAISYVSSASAAANTVAMPTHAAGDLIIAFAYRSNSATLPTLPAGWSSGFNPGGQNTTSMIMGYKVAASGSEATGTWTNATGIAVAVYRKATTESWTTPTMMYNFGSSTTISWASSYYLGPYHTVSQSNTQVWYARFAGHKTATDLTTNTPTGWTARTGLATGVRVMDTNGPSTIDNDSIGALTQTVNTTGAWFSSSIRIEAWDGTGIVCMGSDADVNNGANLIMPMHDIGDLIFAYGDRASNTPPSLPAGYTDLSNGGADTFSTRLAYKIATSNAETKPNLTNAANATISVYRNAKGAWDTIDVGAATNGNSTAMTYTGSTVSPVSGQTTGFVRFEAIKSTEGFVYPGWVLRSIWLTNPSITTRSAMNVTTDADSVGSNGATLASAVAWRTNTIRIAYDPNRYENVNVTNQAVPSGVSGCYVTAIGGGASGGSGVTRNGTGSASNPSGNGGGGGGGGAAVIKVFVPVSSLGSTYSITTGSGGAAPTGTSQNGNNGGSSTFTSGSIAITAGGGAGGVSALLPTGGAGGTYSGVAGLAYTAVENGASGGDGGTYSNHVGKAGSNSTYAGAGGGGGGNNNSSAFNGGAGGSSATVTGGSAGVTNGGTGGSPLAAASGNGGAGAGGGAANTASGTAGAGGTGGVYGGGGGGGGGKEGSFSGAAYIGGAGGDGYTLVEWIPVDPGAFFAAYELF